MSDTQKGVRYNIGKLPRWAQNYIEDLEGQVRNLNHTLTERKAEATPTKVILDYEGSGNLNHYLPNDTRVRFQVGSWKGRDFIEVCLREGPGLEIRGGAALRIRPTFSNVTYVQLDTEP